MQQFAGEAAHPMLPVAEERSRIRLVEFVTEIALHVYWRSTQVAAANDLAHAARHVTELIVVSGRQLQLSLGGECHEGMSLLGIEREGLLHVNMAPALQAHLGELEVTCRRRRDVDNVWSSLAQELAHIAEIMLDRKPFVQLTRHQGFVIAHSNDLASLERLDQGRMGVGDLSATDDGDLKHGFRSRGSS